MSDKEKRDLLRKVEAGDEESLAKLQVLNGRSGLSGDDAAYLAGYLEICEKFLKVAEAQDPDEDPDEDDDGNRGMSLSVAKKEAQASLKAWNEAFKKVVGADVLKKEVVALKIFDAGFDVGKSWSSSRC